MSPFGWAAAVVALLGGLILVHEAGHFLVAKLFGVRVLRFSVGFGPRLFGFKLGETEYRLSLVPLGGYVRLLGEDPNEPEPPGERHRMLTSRPLWQRYLIVMAGPGMNLLLPIVIFFVYYAGQRTLLPAVVGTVVPGEPAAAAGFLPGDRIERVDGEGISTWEDLETLVADSPGKTLRLELRRGGGLEERDLTPTRVSRRGAVGLEETVGWAGWSPRFHLPQVGVIDATLPAFAAGLRTFDFVTAVNGAPVATWAEFQRALDRAGAAPLRLAYLRGGHSALPFAHLEVEELGTAVVIPVPALDPSGRRRYETGISSAETFVFSVEPGSPADRIGLRRADRVLALDGEPVLHWDLLRKRLTASPERTFRLAWATQGGAVREEAFRQEVRPELDAYRQAAHRLVFGATNRSPWKTEEAVPIRSRFAYALVHSIERTGQTIAAMIAGIVDVVRGRVPLSALGGPIMVGYAAGVAAEQGLDQYLWLMAILSVNLGLLNFLPVPVLDGGLLMFFTIELFRGKPPSTRVRAVAGTAGFVVVAVLTLLAARNDVVRYFVR